MSASAPTRGRLSAGSPTAAATHIKVDGTGGVQMALGMMCRISILAVDHPVAAAAAPKGGSRIISAPLRINRAVRAIFGAVMAMITKVRELQMVRTNIPRLALTAARRSAASDA
jgi:hypothetical protein